MSSNLRLIAANLARQRKYKAALIAFEEALRLDPDDYRAAWGIGFMHHCLMNYNEALNGYDAAWDINSSCARICSAKALTWFEMRKLPKAIHWAEAALGIDLECDQAYFILGASFQKEKRFKEAVKAYSGALRILPFPPALEARAALLLKLEDYEGAAADLAKCIQIGYNRFSATMLRGILYVRAKNLEAALAEFSEAIKMDPCHIMPRSWRAYTHREMGNVKSSADDLKEIDTIQEEGKANHDHPVYWNIISFPDTNTL